MDVDLETLSAVDTDPGVVNDGDGDSDETLILKIGGKSEEGPRAEGGDTMTILRGDRGVIVDNEAVLEDRDDGGVESGIAEKEVVSNNVIDKKLSGIVDNDSLENLDVDIGESVVPDKVGDGGEGGVDFGAGEKEVVTSRVVDDNLLEDVDVDIDDSGDVQMGVLTSCEAASVAAGGDEVGNGKGIVENTAKSDKIDKMIIEGVGPGHSEELSDYAGRMGQDAVIGELESGKSGASLDHHGGTVGNLVGESEDEEVDIGGGHEPNMFTNQNITTDESFRSEPKDNVLHAIYQLPARKEGGFFVSDMVWGKVRSHPWWPGQIFDPSMASEIAMKHYKKEKDCYLVAFFGDRTFAWSEASQLRHFHTHFPHVENQSSSEALHLAISCALEEVSRRVELGLACHCIQTDVYEKLSYQNVENTGIQEEASRIESTDASADACSFEPRNFLKYLKSVAQDPSNETDQLEIVTAKAQLLAFNRLKGYYYLPEYQFNELSLNSNSETVSDSCAGEGRNHSDSSLKRKHNNRDIVYTSKRERSMEESMLLMGEDYEDDENIHSNSGSLLSGKRQNTGGTPKQSFKIGDCIVRAASQLTGSPGPSSFLKSINEKYQKVNEISGAFRDVHSQHENHNLDAYSSIAEDMPLQPESVAHDHTKELSANPVGNTSLSPDIASDVRSIKAPKSVKGSPEAFEFEDMKDSYWTDRVVQNGGEEKPERKLNYQVVSLQPPASFSRTPRVHSRKRYSNGNHKIAAERPMSAIDKSKRDMLPAELILNFPDMNSIPSEGKLNNMFRRFGPLKEVETEVDRGSNRARVVFKRASDAEVAYSSCEKFNIFGSSVVRYELSYTPSVSYKAAKIPASQGIESVSLSEIDFASSAHDLEFITMQDLEDATMQDLQYPHPHDLEGVTMQDLEFTTPHDLDFPGSHDMDIVSTHASEVTSIQTLDVSAQDQQPARLEMPSSGHLEFEAGETMTGISGGAPQDMEIATIEDQQRAIQDPGVKTPEDLESGRVQETEVVVVQKIEQVMKRETAGERASVEPTGPVDMEGFAQDDDISLGQDTEVIVAKDGDVRTIGVEKLLKDHGPVSASLFTQDNGSNDIDTKSDVTRLQEPDVGADNPVILSGQKAEQETKAENGINMSNQSTDQETDTIQENQAASRKDDPLEIEMQAPDIEKVKQDPVRIDATEPAIIKDVGMSTGGCEIEDTRDMGSGTKIAENAEVSKSLIKNTDDDASAVIGDTDVEPTEQVEKQVAPDYAKEAPDAEVTHEDNAKIIKSKELEPQIADSSVTGNVVSEGVANVQNIVEDGLITEESDEKDLRIGDSKKDEYKVIESTAKEDLQEAT